MLNAEQIMKKRIRIISIVIIGAILLALMLSACGPTDDSSRNGKGPDNNENDQGAGRFNSNKPDLISLCHKTGSSKNRYVEITVPDTSLVEGHGTHDGDIIPAPENGCPSPEK